MAGSTIASYNIAGLLEKMLSPDKDFRFMAVNDMMTQLQKDTVKLDDDSERKVVRMLLKLLEDKNGEVQNLTVKCLGLLITKIKPFRVEAIVDDLCRNMISNQEPLRDISNIGLKIIISQFPLPSNSLTKSIREYITEHLITAIQKDNFSIQLEALEMLADMLHRFGNVIPSHYMMSILKAIIPKFGSSRQAVRKRAVVLCSILARYCDNELYKEITNHLFNGLALNSSGSESRTYVQCITAICCQSGRRFGEQIERFLPLISKCSEIEDDDTREYCLQALQAFIQRCPKEITASIHEIIEICLQYLAYDPNYNYEEEDDEDSMNMSKEIDEESDQYSDDDDVTWRVRRSAIKCLESIILSRYELLPDFYRTLAPALILRFKERDENVKSDIFQAVISLLRQTNSSTAIKTSSNFMEEDPIYLLQQQVPSIVRGVCGQIKEKSTKTRQNCFKLLNVLCNVLPGALTLHIGDLLPGLQYSLDENNSTSSMKIDALYFIRCLLTSHPPEVFHPHMSLILPPILSALKSNFYKTAAEALLVLQELVKVMRPLSTVSGFDYTAFVNEIYDCTLERLKVSDMEVKEQAILTMGQVISNFGDFLQEELPLCMPIFLDRLKNEITRLTTIKALTNIATSVLFVDLHIVNEAIPVLGSFLRQNQRVLKLNTLQLLDRLIKIYYNHINVDLLQHVIVELPALLDESDLLISQWTLILLESITRYHYCALQDISVNILPKIVVLVKSPFLQGTVLDSMLQFFQGLVKCNLPGLGYNDLLQMLVQPVSRTTDDQGSLNKQVCHSLAKCVAAITTTCKNQTETVVEQFIQNIKTSQCDSRHIFSLLVIGEIGREIDLTYVANLNDFLLQSFMANSEEIKIVASYALGCVSIGNLQENLPFILGKMKDQLELQYLLLHSLKEIITCLSTSPNGVEQLLPFLPDIWRQLLPNGESSEEGVRNIVAECLGKSILTDPSNLLPQLQKHLSHSSPLMRATVVTAIKFVIFDKVQAIDPLLHQSIGDFLHKLQDPDVTVRRAALVVFNSATHNKPSLIRDLLGTVLPHLYDATKIDDKLIQEVEMGPFKHIVDDGLDIRKVAYECMYTLLNCCTDKIDIFEFLNHIEGGLKDHYDIKLLTYLMVGRLAQLHPIAVLQEMDKLVEPLQATCIIKIKANSVQQEREKQEELKKSAIRTVIALLKIPEADKNSSLRELITRIKGSPDLLPIFETYSMQEETDSNHNDSLVRN